MDGKVMMVHGLRDSGLAITLLCPRKRNVDSRPTRLIKSNMETSTSTAPTYVDSSAQSDSAKFVRNFNTNYISTFSTPKWEVPRRSHVISRIFHNSDAFAKSLRKYPHPSIVLDKSHSDEIVQRILSYAQGRNFGKNSKSKSMRSLLRKSSFHKKRRNKSIGVITNSFSPCNRDYLLDKRSNKIDTRYNYLNTNMSKPFEVRYLTGVKRALCSKLMDLCDDSPKICPKMLSRYSHHKKHCPLTTSKLPKIPKKHVEIQAVTNETKGTSVDSASCHGIPNHLDHHPCPCQTPQKCVCKTKSNGEGTIQDMLMKLVPDFTVDEPEDLPTKVDNYIKEWVDQIPPFYNVHMSDKEKETLMKMLTQELQGEDLNSDEAKSKILKCLKNTPALRDKRDSVINDMGDNLANKVKYLAVQHDWQKNITNFISDILNKYDISDDNKKLITKAITHKLKPMVMNRALTNSDFKGFVKEEILGVIQQLPLEVKNVKVAEPNKTPDQSNKGDDLKRKDIENTVMDWINLVPELANMPLNEKKKVITPLVDSLKVNDNPEEMKGLVKNWLNKVANKNGKHLSSRSITKLSKKLVSKLQPAHEIASDEPKITPFKNVDKDKLKKTVNEWYRQIPELQFKDNYDNKTAIENLVNKLKELIQDKDVEDDPSVIKNEVNYWLKDMLKNNNVNIPQRRFDHMVNTLVSNLIKNAKQSSYNFEPSKKDNLQAGIERWITTLPYATTRSKQKSKELTQNLVNDVEFIQKQKYSDNESSRKLQGAVQKWISNLSKEIGVDIHPSDVQHLMDTVLRNTANTPKVYPRKSRPKSYPSQMGVKSRKKWSKVKSQPSDKRVIRDGVSKVLDKYSSNYMNKTKEELISRITNEVEKKLNAIPRPHIAETKGPISHILEDNTKFSPKDIDDIASAVVSKITSFTAPHFLEIPTNATLRSPYDNSGKIRYGLGRNPEYEEEFSMPGSEDLYYSNEDDYTNMYDDLGDSKDLSASGEIASNVPKHKLVKNIAQDISDNIDKFLGNDDAELRGPRGTSTPEKESQASLETLSITSITDRLRSNKQVHEINQVKKILNSWLNNINVDENLKNQVIKDLAEDILDRQKYLKISNSQSDEHAEMEHLKFQVFKRLNNVVSDEELSHYIANIEELANRLGLIGADSGETQESLAYKKQLHIVISRTLPYVHDDSFEVFKRDLADAFVSLHFCMGDQAERNKYRNKIRQEISNFCCDYLAKHPSPNLSTKQLNKELYIALLKVPVPEKELLEPTYRISLIQEEIHDWINKTQPSILKSMKIRKSISGCAKQIFKVQNKSTTDTDKNMLNIIRNWLKNFCSVSGQNIDIEREAQVLFYNIKNVVQEDGDRLQVREGSDIINIHISQSVEATNKHDNGTQYTPMIPPPSTLSAEDQAHLDRVRARNALNEIHIQSHNITKDASNDPPPVNISTQTGITIHGDGSAPQRIDKKLNVDIAPKVVVKEYHWESPKSTPRAINTNSPSISKQGTVEITHEYQSPRAQQPNIISQSTNLSLQHSSTQNQNKSPRHIPQTVIENRQNIERIIYPREDVTPRPVLSGYPTPYEAMKRNRLDDRESLKCMDYGQKLRRKPERYEKIIKCCRCGGRMISKCRSRQCITFDHKMCPKCFARSCPHPTAMYFQSYF